jgi:hypothetical protein
MTIGEGKHIGGLEARRVAECIEPDNGIVKPAPPSNVERGSYDSGNTHAAELNEFICPKPHVVGTQSRRTACVRPDQFDRQMIVHPFRTMQRRRRQPRDDAFSMRVQPRRLRARWRTVSAASFGT